MTIRATNGDIQSCDPLQSALLLSGIPTSYGFVGCRYLCVTTVLKSAYLGLGLKPVFHDVFPEGGTEPLAESGHAAAPTHAERCGGAG